MKVISLIGNELTVDLDEKERGIFFRQGLQEWVNNELNGKFKVLPVYDEDEAKEIKNKYEIGDELFEEFIKDGIIFAIKEGIKRSDNKKDLKRF